jgi:hypothetical protein
VVPVGADGLVPSGGSTFDLRHSDVAIDAGGNYDVVWEHHYSDGGSDIFLRTFNASGAPTSSDITIANSSLSQELPRVATSPDGTHLVVVWQQSDSNDASSLYQIHYDYRNPAGVGVTGTVSTASAFANVRPDVAMAADGSFVVVFTEQLTNTDYDISYRRFDANGNPIDSTQKPVAQKSDIEDNAAVAITPNGQQFVVAWENHTDHEIHDTIFNGSGNAVGMPGQAIDAPVSGASVLKPALGLAADGSFFLASQDTASNGVTGLAVHVSRFAADNSKLWGAVLPPPAGFDRTYEPSVAVADDGRAIVTYQAANSSPFREGVYFQAYSATGAPDGSGFVNTTTGGHTFSTSVARRGDQIAVTFTSTTNSEDTIRARLLQEMAPPPPAPQAPAARNVYAELVTERLGRGRRRFRVVIRFADTDQVKTSFVSPLQAPRYRAISVLARDLTGDGINDVVVVTGRRGRRAVSFTMPA